MMIHCHCIHSSIRVKLYSQNDRGTYENRKKTFRSLALILCVSYTKRIIARMALKLAHISVSLYCVQNIRATQKKKNKREM